MNDIQDTTDLVEVPRDEADRRIRDAVHRRKVHDAARDALVETGMPYKHAVAAVRVIASGAVPAVVIIY